MAVIASSTYSLLAEEEQRLGEYQDSVEATQGDRHASRDKVRWLLDVVSDLD